MVEKRILCLPNFSFCPSVHLSVRNGEITERMSKRFIFNCEAENHRARSYVYWTVHFLNSWIKIDQLDVTCFVISLFTAQLVSNVSTSIFRNLRLIVDLFHVLYCSGSMCVGVTVWFGWVGVCIWKIFSSINIRKYRRMLKSDSEIHLCVLVLQK